MLVSCRGEVSRITFSVIALLLFPPSVLKFRSEFQPNLGSAARAHNLSVLLGWLPDKYRLSLSPLPAQGLKRG